MAAKTKKTPETKGLAIQIPAIETKRLAVTIRGTAPLICNRFTAKARGQIIDGAKPKSGKRPPRDPDAAYEGSLYVMKGGTANKPQHGFPATAFKSCMVSACSQISGVTKVFARGAFHIIGDTDNLVKIQGTPHRREDVVRLQGKTADIRWRGCFESWKIKIAIEYNSGAIDAANVVNLLNVAGFSYGIGEWRPERNGPYGRFEVMAGGLS